jgi:hemoglobin/transferrin/lactoferrin receptor protein
LRFDQGRAAQEFSAANCGVLVYASEQHVSVSQPFIHQLDAIFMAKQNMIAQRKAVRGEPALKRLAGLLAVLCAWPVAAQVDTSEPKEPVAAPVVVTPARKQAYVHELAGSISTVDRKQIAQQQARSIGEALADEPDVSVANDKRRFGESQVNIRGIDGNRILILTDGVRAADYRAAGTSNYDAAGRDMPFPEFLKQIEVLRGPASSLYGSDAIGGVLGVLTLDPADLLKGRDFASGGDFSYHSVDRSKRASVWLATRNDSFQSLLMAGHVRGEETDNQGSRRTQGNTRTAPNPVDYQQSNFLGKFIYTPDHRQRFKLSLEHKEGESDVDVQRVSNGSSLSRVSQNSGVDSLNRDRVQLDYEYTPDESWFDNLGVKLYTQKQRTDNQNQQLRANTASTCSATTAGAMNCLVANRYDYEQTHSGIGIQQEKSLQWGVQHALVWGLDFDRAETEERTDTTWTNLATGVSSKTLLGYTYPAAYYPRGHTDQLGLFAEDRMRLGAWHLTPGLRFDRYRLAPDNDPLYVRADGRSAASKDDQRISPKLAVLYDLRDDWNVYAQYVEGFRGPSYEEVNRYFVNGSSAYGVFGNPDLKPETSHGFEIGSKYEGSRWSSQFALYQTRYKNFIDYQLLGASDPRNIYVSGTRYSTYLYQNLQRVVIRGADWRGQWQVSPKLRLLASAALTRGYDADTRRPLNSVEPKRASLAAQWTQNEHWGGEWRLRAATGKNNIDTSSTAYFRTPGYGVNDLGVWWQASRKLRLNFNLNNIFDKTYYLWGDVVRAGLTASDTAPEFYTQPGRNFAISAKLEF